MCVCVCVSVFVYVCVSANKDNASEIGDSPRVSSCVERRVVRKPVRVNHRPLSLKGSPHP